VDRESVRHRTSEEFATASIAEQVIAALVGVRESAVSPVTNGRSRCT
jgi:hypothetical protein